MNFLFLFGQHLACISSWYTFSVFNGLWGLHFSLILATISKNQPSDTSFPDPYYPVANHENVNSSDVNAPRYLGGGMCRFRSTNLYGIVAHMGVVQGVKMMNALLNRAPGKYKGILIFL
jgi:hypothetical protein